MTRILNRAGVSLRLNIKPFRLLSLGKMSTVPNSAVVVPRKAQVVICGGGVIGASVAYHLAARGINEVVLLERGRLACGTTWHAAGLVGAMRQNETQMKLCIYSQNLYKWMEENGYPTGYKQCGSIHIGTSRDRMIELQRAADSCRKNDVEVVELSPTGLKEKIPWINVADIQGGFWLPKDGAASPTDVCQSLAKMAVEKGAQVYEGCEVTRILTSKAGAVSGVETSLGDIQCQQVVLCGGMWSRNLASRTIPSVSLAQQATEHFYLVTQPMTGVDLMTPVMRDADASTYVREWSGGFLLGVFDSPAVPVFPDAPPADFQFQLFPDNWEHYQPHYDAVTHRFPFLKDVEIRHMNNGPESFTPDGIPLLGEVPEVSGFLVATGMNSRGIALGGGVGRTMAELIVDGLPSLDCSLLDAKRLFPKRVTHKYLWDMAKDIVGEQYELHYPKHAHRSDIPGVSALSRLLTEEGAFYADMNGMNIPFWFSKSETSAHTKETFGKPSWFEAVEEEQSACQEGVGFADIRGLVGTLSLTGPPKYVEQLFVDPVHKFAAGSVVHTSLLNNQGQYITECSLILQGNDSYTMLYPKSCERHLVSWLRSHQPGGINFKLQEDLDTLLLIGPSPDLLHTLGSESLMPKENSVVVGAFDSKESLLLNCPWLPASHVLISIPSKATEVMYQSLKSNSGQAKFRPVGYYCLDALRIENGIPWWGYEINNSITPLTAGRAQHFLDQSKIFIGKSALTRGSGSQKSHTLIHFTVEGCKVEDDIWPWGGEPIYAGQRGIGNVSSICYSQKHSAFRGLAVVELEMPLNHQQIELVNAGKRYPLKLIQ